MAIWLWLANNAFDLWNAIGIGGGLVGLWLAVKTLREEATARRIGNLIMLASNHRELMEVFYRDLPLSRIFNVSVDFASTPLSFGEEVYMGVLVEHLFSAYRAMQYDLTIKPEGLRQDIQNVFALPIPKMVWERMKSLQDEDFVAFIEGCLEDH